MNDERVKCVVWMDIITRLVGLRAIIQPPALVNIPDHHDTSNKSNAWSKIMGSVQSNSRMLTE